jgi:uncharacterized protein (DUF1800 family)
MNAGEERAAVAHLLRRAGFGAGAAELDEYAALGFAGSVERLLTPEGVEDELDARVAALGLDDGKLADLQLRWLYRMVNSRRPLQEKLALFWHGHFATASAKVGSPELMWAQNELFRARGLGTFGELLLAVSRDPAMLIWLDGKDNRKGKPNENYGRELLELFALGIGNYGEDDVWAAARAFTGWSFKVLEERPNGNGKRPARAEFAFNPNQHDNSVKTFLGQTGNWNGDDIIRLTLAHPACARFIARKLFSFFVWDSPDDATVAPFAAVLAGGYDIRATLRAIFLSPEFISARARRAKIKSPAELAAGLLRTLGVAMPPKETLVSLRKMGQELFNPPHVGGWASGLAWINPSSLLERFNFANRVITARGAANGPAFDPARLLAGKAIATPEELADHVIGLLLDGAIAPEGRDALIGYLRLDDQGRPAAFKLDGKTLDGKVRGLLHLAMATPAYQLN